MLIYSMTSTLCMLLIMFMNMEGTDYFGKEKEPTYRDLEKIAKRIDKKTCLGEYCLLKKNGNDKKTEGVEKKK